MIDIDKISEIDLAAAYRAKAARYNSIADAIEGRVTTPPITTFNPAPPAPNNGSGQMAPWLADSKLAAMRNYLKKQSYRLSRLCSIIQISEDDAAALIARHDSGIVFGERGWLKLAAAAAQEEGFLQ